MYRETMTGILFFFLHYFQSDCDEKGNGGCYFVFIHVARGDIVSRDKFWFVNSPLQIQPTF